MEGEIQVVLHLLYKPYFYVNKRKSLIHKCKYLPTWCSLLNKERLIKIYWILMLMRLQKERIK